MKESQNVNRAVYIYKPASGYVQTFSYDPDRGVVDALPGSDNATVSVFFDNILRRPDAGDACLSIE